MIKQNKRPHLLCYILDLARKTGKKFNRVSENSSQYETQKVVDINKKILRNHATSKHHQTARSLLERRLARNMEKSLKQAEEIQLAKDCNKFEVTANMFRLVFTEVQTNIALYNHASLVRTIKTIGGNLGHHHYERRSALRMAKVISDDYHKSLIGHILSSDTYWSVILDGSTDVRQNHYLVVLLQGLEDNMPRVYLYRLIELGQKEDSQALTDVLIKAFEEDGIATVMKEKLTAFVSDGASVRKCMKV